MINLTLILHRPTFNSLIRSQPTRQFSCTTPLEVLIRRNIESIRKATRNTDLALNYFDSFYSKVYGKSWPSIRLGLLSPKKYCVILNSFVDNEDIHKELVDEQKSVYLKRYYDKHLQSYTRHQLRQQILDNKRARKRELIAKNQNIDVASIDPDAIEVSDVSDSELKLDQTSDGSLSTAEDLFEMFSDRRMDDDEKYFVNKASTQICLDDFVPATKMLYQEESYNELAYYEGYNEEMKLDVEFKDEPILNMDDELKIYSFPRSSWNTFRQPELVSKANLLSYYILDGASVLTVLALDLRLNDDCADYCAAPGGKSLSMLMSLKPKHILCNDNSASRLSRLSRVFQTYVPDINYFKDTVHITRKDARKLIYPDTFDKIIVDVPCSNDRNSVESLENNIFKRARTEERLNLPGTQCDILKAALKSLKVKGAVVYSTCTLSPIENDGVVFKALSQLQEEGFPAKYAVMNLKEAFRPLRGLFKFHTTFKYGQQVVPNICSNFGPMYFSKIKRLS